MAAKPNVKEGAEDKPGESLEEGEDEAARHARITARLAQSGGFNPFAGGPLVRERPLVYRHDRRISRGLEKWTSP